MRRRRRINRRVYSSIGANHVWHVDGYSVLRCSFRGNQIMVVKLRRSEVIRRSKLVKKQTCGKADDAKKRSHYAKMRGNFASSHRSFALYDKLKPFGFSIHGCIDGYCIRYCFMPVIQKDLDDLLEQWNDHYVSQSRQSVCPAGRPNIIHQLSSEKGNE
ncbi:hypothetical protein FSP39_007634 [Pinctada imbricata]|uniref:Uncharacterized protein n=1 Tax=Pinctada imbricata TaxID=66713 RepID=A0AA88YBB4_PINIB|nr:hypothetical protein FSP39_007634 [Pinctada imbricata]